MVVDKYNRIPFLKHAPELDLEFLIAQDVEVRVYKVKDFALVVYQESPVRMWTEYVTKGSKAYLMQVKTDKVLNSLSPREKAQFIESWSLLKARGKKKK